MTGNDRQAMGGQIAAHQLQIGPACRAGHHLQHQLAAPGPHVVAVSWDQRWWPIGGRMLEDHRAHAALADLWLG